MNCLLRARARGQSVFVCKSRAYHRVLNTCKMSCAMWGGGTARLLILTVLKLHVFLVLFLLVETINRRGRRNWRSQRKPSTTSSTKCHILKPKKSKPPTRLQHWWQSCAGKADEPTLTASVAFHCLLCAYPETPRPRCGRRAGQGGGGISSHSHIAGAV